MNGKILNVSRYCTHDGPGIRTTVFLKGCPLVCAWCHNPESQHGYVEIMFDERKCTQCGRCAVVCRCGCHTITPVRRYDRTRCLHCGACAQACPTHALTRYGRTVPASEIIEEVMRDTVFYRISGGGVTISGGEPLAQPDFTAEILQACRAQQISTAIETSGYATPEALAKVLPHCSLVLFDLKETDSQNHQAFTGVPLAPILWNLQMIDRSGVPIILRAPIIPGWNDRPTHLTRLHALARSLVHCHRVDVMAYHALGEYKYEQLQRSYACRSVQAPNPETVHQWERVFSDIS